MSFRYVDSEIRPLTRLSRLYVSIQLLDWILWTEFILILQAHESTIFIQYYSWKRFIIWSLFWTETFIFVASFSRKICPRWNSVFGAIWWSVFINSYLLGFSVEQQLYKIRLFLSFNVEFAKQWRVFEDFRTHL